MSELQSTHEESWRPVVGYEGVYEVSDRGQVRRVTPGRNTHPGKVLRYNITGRDFRSGLGYLQVTLTKDGKQRPYSVHRLVASAFIGVIPPNLTVNHLDGNKQNNWVGNLEIVTRKVNQQHAVRTGLAPRGGGQAKLTTEAVREIRDAGRALARGDICTTHDELAIKYGVSRSLISRIIRGVCWRHILDTE